MTKLYKDQKGFSAVETLIVFIIIILIVMVGWLIYKNNHTTIKTVLSSKSAKITSNTASSSTSTYSDWKTTCDSVSSTCFLYPATWTPQSGLGNQGITITNIGSSVSVEEYPEPSNCSTNQPSDMGQFHVISVNNINSKKLNLDVVGGYFLNQLNGEPSYNPSYIVTNVKNVNTYNVKVSSTISFPNAWTCYDYNILPAEASSQPTGSISYDASTATASSWFLTDDAKISLQILQSIYKK